MIIKDSATGNTVSVDSNNRLRTFSISQHEDKQTNINGLYWSMYAQETPAGIGDYFWYIENTGVFDLAITDVRVKSTAISDIFIESVTGTPSYSGGGTDIGITSRNLGSSQVPAVTAKHDPDITGLTSEGTLFFIGLDTANEVFHLRTSSNIIIPQGKAVGFQEKIASGTIDMLVSLSRVGV